jgi:glycosyltransferase involved in cell wall biosynthesis
MKVLLANTTCKIGGVSTFMLSMRTALASLGHESELFFFEHGSMERYLPADCRVHFGSLADCLRLIDRGAFTVVHANNVDWTTGISAVRGIGAKLVLTAHKVRAAAVTYGWNHGNCDALVAVSRWIKDGLQPFTDVPIQVVANGIDTDRFTPALGTVSARPIVVWVGRGGAARKRLQAFAAIAPRLQQAGVRVWVLDQQGPETLAATFPEAAASLKAAAERWHGAGVAEMPQIYRDVAASGGCIVSTASMEGLPLTLLEAQACGCVAIGGDVLGVNECVVPELGGVLYPLDTPPQQLATLIIDTVSDREGMRRRQAQALAYAREAFSVRRMAADYLRIYNDAPFGVVDDLRARWRARLRLSPIAHRSAYMGQRCGVGYRQYATSQQLADAGEARLAMASCRASLHTSPTIFLKPARLAHLMRLQLKSR